MKKLCLIWFAAAAALTAASIFMKRVKIKCGSSPFAADMYTYKKTGGFSAAFITNQKPQSLVKNAAKNYFGRF